METTEDAGSNGRPALRLITQAGVAPAVSTKQSIIAVDDLRNFISVPSSHRHLCYIHSDIVSRYPIDESFEELVDVRALFQKQGLPVSLNLPDLDHQKSFFLREDAASRLVKAAEFVRKTSGGDLMLRILEAYRPIGMKELHFEQVKRWLGMSPAGEVSKSEVLARMEKWLVHEGNPEAHNSGGAVDVTLAIVEGGRELPMGSPWLAASPAAHTWSQKISEQDRFNRTLLFVAMTMAGFVNTASEWWHYSYGDRYWAAFLDKPYAQYGVVKK